MRGMEGGGKKVGKRRRISPSRRHALARRDGLAWRLWGRCGPMWVYQCPVCGNLIRTGTATGGHVVPLGEGGGDEDGNLRIECLHCNAAENITRLLRGSSDAHLRIEGAERRHRERLLGERGRPQVFSNVPVYWKGRLISFTSRRRASLFIRDGLAESRPEGGIHFLKTPSNTETAPTDPIENRCVRCGARKGLCRFRFFPLWHPRGRTARPSLFSRPVCAVCLETFEIAYAVEITRAAKGTILAWEAERMRMQEVKAVALEAWSRRRSGSPLPEELCRDFQQVFELNPLEIPVQNLRRLSLMAGCDLRRTEQAAFAAVGHTLMDSNLDFPELFRRIAAGAYTLAPADLPRLDFSRYTGKGRNS